jgi:hypothetical protein
MKRRIALGLAIATIALFSAVAYSTLGFQHPPSKTLTLDVSWARSYDLTSLSREAELIVKGVVIGERALSEYDLSFTLHTVRVERVIKGSLPTESSETIIVLQTGGQVDGTMLEVSDDPLMKPGDTLILFLERYQQGFADKLAGTVFVPLGGPQGRFYLQSGRVYSAGEVYPRAELVTRHLKTGGVAEEQFVMQVQLLMGYPE